ncbi:MAG TPA: DNA polymerase IV [Chloroflexia bacterium]|nr:DNA polymerase IV [Chloroflexia bacterium]
MGNAEGYKQADLWRQPARRWVVHVDMDAFFASVEQLDRPELRGLPVIVGNSPLSMERLRELADEARKLPRMPEFIKGVRGVVASASYEARAFGVRSAMPLAKALALCPDAVVVAGRFGRYGEMAEQLRRVWGEFSPVVEPVSLDEAYLDMTGCELSEGPIREVGERLKARIREATNLTASVGIGSSKLMAKIASDLDKPDGLVVVAHGDEARTLAPLPVRALQGVGPRTAATLGALGIRTVGELAHAREDVLAAHFGLDHAQSLLRRAVGIDDTPVEVPGDPKSISRETTLAEDESRLPELAAMLRPLADHVAWQLRDEGFHARCIYIKLRLLPVKRVWRPGGSGFGRLITRRCTLPMPTDAGQVVYEAASRLLESAAKSTGLGNGEEVVRLIGVGAASLVHTEDLVIRLPPPDGKKNATAKPAPPPTVDSTEDAPLVSHERDNRLNASLDRIRERYGFSAIAPAATVKRP